MEFVLYKTLERISECSDYEIQQILKEESPRLEITKSLLNVLHNFAVLHNIRLNKRQKAAFHPFTGAVLRLLGNSSLKKKKSILGRHPHLTRLIAKTCPRPKASSS